MEFARALKTLWRRRRLVGLGVLVAAIAATLSVYQVGLVPPSLTSRTNVFAAASTQILVDTPDSAFVGTGEDVEPLNVRAGVFARFLSSPVAIDLIAREAKLPADAIEGQGPYSQSIPRFELEPTAEKRSSQIIGERALYRLRFENSPGVPIITVFAQAPTYEEAARLADAVPRALRGYVEQIQGRQGTPVRSRVAIRKLGDATGGVVNGNADVQIAALVFGVVLAGWCILLVPGATIARGWRPGRPRSGSDRGANRHRNGYGGGLTPEAISRREPERTR
jgi:hypothetical protein